jgi:hypothetical protein
MPYMFGYTTIIVGGIRLWAGVVLFRMVSSILQATKALRESRVIALLCF